MENTERRAVLIKVSKNIAATVVEFHADYRPRSWSPQAGQWLVYGLERTFGFPAAAQLCAIVERAWKRGEDIEPPILDFLIGWDKRAH